MQIARETPFFDRPGVIALTSAMIVLLGYYSVRLTGAYESLIAVAGIPLGLGLMTTKPYPWFLGFIVLVYFRIPEAMPVLLHFKLIFLFGLMCLGTLVWHTLIEETMTFPPLRVELRALLLLFLAVTIGIGFAYDRAQSFDNWSAGYWKTVAICVALAGIMNTRDQIRQAVWALLAGGTFIAAVAVYNRVNGIGLVEGTRVTIGRDYRSPLGDPNDLALVLLTPLSLALAMTFNAGTRTGRLIGLSLAVLVTAAIIATQSRGALLGTLGVLFVVGQWHVRSRWMRIAVVVMSALALFYMMDIGGRASGGYAEVSQKGVDESSKIRLIIWQSAINMALENPFNGVGINNFAHALYLYAPPWFRLSFVAHSAWFQVLGETGFPGLLLFLTMVLTAMRSAYVSFARLQNLPADPYIRILCLGLLSSLVGYCIAATFLTAGFGWQIYLLVGFTAGTARYVSNLDRASALQHTQPDKALAPAPA
jgi:putative inorganic carbon (hco3(-)) transporter